MICSSFPLNTHCNCGGVESEFGYLERGNVMVVQEHVFFNL
jgi:hypothetical protein